MTQTRKSKELDHYLKSVINSVPTKLESFMSSEDKKMTYYTGNWATDVLNNYTEKQAQKIFDNANQYRDKLDFFQIKLKDTYEDYNENTLQAYDYIARVK